MPLPVLTATWDLDLDLANAAAAGREFPLRLMARNQTGAPVTAARAWVSFDDGGTWKAVPLSGGDGTYRGSVRHPRLEDTTGTVSLRYEITDAGGSSLEQTVYRAYLLK